MFYRSYLAAFTAWQRLKAKDPEFWKNAVIQPAEEVYSGDPEEFRGYFVITFGIEEE